MDNRFNFRAWLKEEKKMAYVGGLHVDGVINVLSKCGTKWRKFSAKDYILMQCTGLLATSSYRGESEEDRLIYEGDIVEIPYINSAITINTVAYSEYGFVVKSRNQNDEAHKEINFSLADIGFAFQKEGKIIGNIHEHPELLEND